MASTSRLILEWNNLGLFPDTFKEFCLGLAKNSCLEKLDVQNNRLNAECASMLSNALTSNKALKSLGKCTLVTSTKTIRFIIYLCFAYLCLDLRWNEIGWQGGQYIYEALQNNNLIENIQLQGNCIPADLLQAIGKWFVKLQGLFSPSLPCCFFHKLNFFQTNVPHTICPVTR